jgi:hypothetical protein
MSSGLPALPVAICCSQLVSSCHHSRLVPDSWYASYGECSVRRWHACSV